MQGAGFARGGQLKPSSPGKAVPDATREQMFIALAQRFVPQSSASQGAFVRPHPVVRRMVAAEDAAQSAEGLRLEVELGRPAELASIDGDDHAAVTTRDAHGRGRRIDPVGTIPVPETEEALRRIQLERVVGAEVLSVACGRIRVRVDVELGDRSVQGHARAVDAEDDLTARVIVRDHDSGDVRGRTVAARSA